MKRAMVLPLARRSLPNYLDELRRRELADWPQFLERAWAIVSIQLEKPEVAKTTVLESVAAAHACAVAISSRATVNTRAEAREQVTKAVLKLKNCTKRLPAGMKRAFNEDAQTAFEDGHFDLESFSHFIHACAARTFKFETTADINRIRQAIGLVENVDAASPQSPRLLVEYEAMLPFERTRIERDLQALVDATPANLAAEQIFGVLVKALDEAAKAEFQSNSGDLLIEYTRKIVAIWRTLGLRPARLWDNEKPERRSPFHRFVQLVLLDHFDPRSRLFDPLSPDEKKAARQRLVELQKDQFRDEPNLLKDIRHVPSYEWLISDHHLKQALAADPKITP